MWKSLYVVKIFQFYIHLTQILELLYRGKIMMFIFCKKVCSSKFWNFLKKYSKFWAFFKKKIICTFFRFLKYWYACKKILSLQHSFHSCFCSLLLVKRPIFAHFAKAISLKANLGLFLFSLYFTYLCMHFINYDELSAVTKVFETEA